MNADSSTALAKKKIYQLAKELNRSHDTLIEFLSKRGFKRLYIMSVVTEDMMQEVDAHFKKDKEGAVKHQRKIQTIREPQQQCSVTKRVEPIREKIIIHKAIPSFDKKPDLIIPRRKDIALKSNWSIFEKIVNSKRIKSLYHFTDKRNIPSIKQYGGLFSWYSCEKNNIIIPYFVSNNLSRNLDKRKCLEDFVRLSFNRNQPMKYVVEKSENPLIILEIEPEVIYWSETKFSDRNATDNNAQIGDSYEDFMKIDFSTVMKETWKGVLEKKLFQAEILVKTKIPIKFIRNI